MLSSVSVFFLLFCTCKASDVHLIPSIKSLIKLLESPVKISILSCWSFEQKYDFLREFLQPFSDTPETYELALKDISMDSIPEGIDEHRNLIVLDFNCSQTVGFLEDVEYKITNRYKWILINGNDTDIVNILQNLPVFPNSEVYYLVSGDDKYFVKQAYRTSPSSSLILEQFAIFYCYNNTMIYDSTFSSKVHRRRNLLGLKLRATLVITNNETLKHLHDYRDKYIDTISKANYLQTNRLIEYLNASVEYSFVETWGYMDKETGRFNGMIGDLVENRSDIGATALFVTPDRIKFIEYIAMPTPTVSKFVFRSPKLSYTDDVFLLPFDTLVWYCVISLFIISVIMLTFTALTEWRVFNSSLDNSNSSVLKPSPKDIIFLVFGGICQQGSAVSPKSLTARIVMIVTFIALMFLHTSYSAYIVALLQSPSTRIQTLDDLLHSRLKFGADDTVFNRYYFSHATESIRRKIYEQKIVQKDSSENFVPLTDGVERIRHGLYAFHMELGVGYKIMEETYLEDEKCGLQEIQYLQVIDPWYAIQKNSSYKDLLKTGMMLLHEYGLQSRENHRLYTKKPQCLSGGGKFITASLIDVRSALRVLFCGQIISILMLIIEIFISRYDRKRQK